VVFKKSGQWYVRLALKPMGPRPSKTGAIASAIEVARLAESDGKPRVCRNGPDRPSSSSTGRNVPRNTVLEAEDGAQPWLRTIRWTAALTGIAGGILLAIKVPWSGWGFAFFALSSAAWIAAGLVMRVRSLVMVNTVLLLTNLIGIYRWLLA
jgi:hypothetical protein